MSDRSFPTPGAVSAHEARAHVHIAGSAAPPRSRDLRTSFLLGLLCLLVYNANMRPISAGDTYPARYLPFAIWRFHTVLLDPVSTITAQGRGHAASWMVPVHGGHIVSLYPIVVPVFVAPLYLPAVVYLHTRGWDEPRLDRVARIMEKLSASLLAAITVALVYLLLRRRARPATALLLTVVFAFGTTTWMISSQALWQHGLAELLIVSALLLLTGPCTRPRVLAAGFFCGLIPFNRPPDAILTAALGIYGLWWARRWWPLLIAGGAVPAALVLAYNLGPVGNVVGAYALIGDITFFRYGLLSGIAGLLFSPTRGLFVFSPFLLFVPFYLRHALGDRNTRALTMACCAAIGLLVLVYAKTDWRQGQCWGPRWLTDILPLLVWMLPPVFSALGRSARAAFIAACAIAILIEAVGAFWYTGDSQAPIFAIPAGPDQMRAAWNPRNAPFIFELRHAPAETELFTYVREFVYTMTATESSPRFLASRGLPPPPAPSAGAFPDAPDWTTLSAGSNDLSLRERVASDALAGRQQPGGYWLTSFTGEPRFTQPRFELNTFLTAVMVDVLSPVAKAAGLDESLVLARRHLTSQIEAGGLVRYHGRPDAPTLPRLGCVITPDADNTALVWRIAPATHSGLLPAALGTLRRYRTSDGLYRTWLASPEHYQCIDPGRDPDPADIGIQMHVLMLLAQADPPAGHDLCRALAGAVDDDRIWVYYRMAPLIPILRQADLQAAGCALSLPASRVQTTVRGQELWVEASQLLDRMLRGRDPGPSPAEVLPLLETLSRDDFSFVRESPPLIYHNDLTASQRRFYWSEDLGYALWLRLYFENLRHGQAAGRVSARYGS